MPKPNDSNRCHSPPIGHKGRRGHWSSSLAFEERLQITDALAWWPGAQTGANALAGEHSGSGMTTGLGLNGLCNACRHVQLVGHSLGRSPAARFRQDVSSCCLKLRTQRPVHAKVSWKDPGVVGVLLVCFQFNPNGHHQLKT